MIDCYSEYIYVCIHAYQLQPFTYLRVEEYPDVLTPFYHREHYEKDGDIELIGKLIYLSARLMKMTIVMTTTNMRMVVMMVKMTTIHQN